MVVQTAARTDIQIQYAISTLQYHFKQENPTWPIFISS